MNNITVLSPDVCTGCGMCSNICPVSAINMKSDDNGFLCPNVSENCTDCGLCKEKCPQLSEIVMQAEEPVCYAAWANEETRPKGSSGGVFPALAEWALSENGSACGASFDNDWRGVSQIMITNSEELSRLYKSKYVQSDCKNIYSQVKEQLSESDNPVLFCGCPCQVDALKKFLGKDYDNLILIDFLCHGVPSPLAWRALLEEVTAGHPQIVKADFRDKKHGWGTLISVECADEFVHYDQWNGNYFDAFLSGLAMRKSCLQCRYATEKRVGDITLGDFWGVDKVKPAYDDRKGTSLVLCNTEKGKQAVEAVKKAFSMCEYVPFEQVMETAHRTNGALVRPVYEPKMRKCFFRHLSKGDSFSKSYRYAKKSLLDVGIVAWWFENPRSNYGSTLNAYALYEYVMSLGLSTMLISLPGMPTREHCGEFNKKEGYRMSISYSLDELSANNRYVDTYLMGSDQMWYYHDLNKLKNTFFLDFVSSDKKKISYGTSFGHPKHFFPKERLGLTHELLSRFDEISVRELDGVDILQRDFGVFAEQVVDPVFICDKCNYFRIASRAARKNEGKFVFSYMLDPTEEKITALKHIAKTLNLPIVSVTDTQFNSDEKTKMLEDCGVIRDMSVDELLYHLANAEYILTDSYHGTCFSLIFEKPFVTIINKNRGTSRFATIETLFEIGDRFVNNAVDIINSETLFLSPDYEKITPRINRETGRSRRWLEIALLSPKKEKQFNMLDMYIDRISKLTAELRAYKEK